MITIKQISITDLSTDAIVNAANEHLQAGGGVCGAIFSAAGYDKLQAACDVFKHCDTGSAVITSGFDLKAKYVIHAVGPIWRGGQNGEPQALYNAYKRSLELAAELGFSPDFDSLAPFAGDNLMKLEAMTQCSLAEALLIPMNGAERSGIAESLIRYIAFHSESPVNIKSLAVLKEVLVLRS